VDLTGLVAPEETLRVGEPRAPTLLGHVEVAPNSDIATFSPTTPAALRDLSRAAILPGAAVRLGNGVSGKGVFTTTIDSAGAYKAKLSFMGNSPGDYMLDNFARFRLKFTPSPGAATIVYTPCVTYGGPFMSAGSPAFDSVRAAALQAAVETVVGVGNAYVEAFSCSQCSLNNNGDQVDYTVELSGVDAAGVPGILALDPSNDGAVDFPDVCCNLAVTTPGVCAGYFSSSKTSSSFSDLDFGLFNVARTAGSFKLAAPIPGDWTAPTTRVPLFALPNTITVARNVPAAYSLSYPLTSDTFGLDIEIFGASIALPPQTGGCYSWNNPMLPALIMADIATAVNPSTLVPVGPNHLSTFGPIYVTRSVLAGVATLKVVYSKYLPSAGTPLAFSPGGACIISSPSAPSALIVSTPVSANNVPWPAFTATSLPLATSWRGRRATLPLYRATGVAVELGFPSALGAVPLVAGVPAASTLTGSGVMLDVATVLPGVPPTSALLFNLQPGAPLFAHVAANNRLGPGPWSNVATSLPVSVPLPPQNVRLAPATRAYEVTNVWITGGARAEVQTVTTSADAVAEVQTLRTSATAGTTIGGTLALAFNGVSTLDSAFTLSLSSTQPLADGGFKLSVNNAGLNNPATTTCISWAAPAEGGAGSLSTLLAGVIQASTFGIITPNALRVRREAVDTSVAGVYVYSWSVFVPSVFTASYPFTVTVVVDGSCAPWAAASSASSPGVNVSQNWAPRTPPPLPATATEAQMAAALSYLPDILAANVVRTLASVEGGFAWTVTLALVGDALSSGPLPLIDCSHSSATLTPAGAGCAANREVPRNTLDGGWYLSLPLEQGASAPVSTGVLPFDASASAVQAAVGALFVPIPYPVTVTRSAAPTPVGGFTWSVTFDGIAGDVAQLVPTSLLRGAGAAAVVATTVPGNTLGGAFTLRYGRAESAPIDWNATADAFAAALAPAGLPLLRVARAPAHPGAPSHGTAWRVTYSTPGDVAGLLPGNAGGLLGEGAAVVTREAVKGAMETGGQLALSMAPPAFPSGLPITRYEVQWDVRPTFDSASPADRGRAVLDSRDFLYGTQLLSVVSGGPLTGGCAGAGTVGGTWAVTYGGALGAGGAPYDAADAAARTTAQLPFDATADQVRAAVAVLRGVTGVAVARSASRVPLLSVDDGSTAITASAPPSASPGAAAAAWDTVVLNPAAPQLSVGVPVWLGGAAYAVRGISHAPDGSSSTLQLGIAVNHLATAYFANGTLDHIPVFRSGGGFTYAVTLTGAAGAALQPFVPASHNLSCPSPNSANVPALVTVSHPPCNKCAYLPGAPTLHKGTTVYARAWAVNSAGISVASSSVAAAVPAAVPAAPAAVALFPVSDAALRVTWKPPLDDGFSRGDGDGVLAYVVEWDASPNFDSGAGSAPGRPVPSGRVTLPAAALRLAGPPPYTTLIDRNSTEANAAPLPLGVRLYARVAALNAVGEDDNAQWAVGASGLLPPGGGQPYTSNRVYGAPTPAFATTAFQVPSALPPYVVPGTGSALQSLSATSLRLSLRPPLDDGGKPVTAVEAWYSVDGAALAAALAGAPAPPGAGAVTKVTLPLPTLTSVPAVAPSLVLPAGLPALLLTDVAGLAPGAPVALSARAINAVGAGPWTSAGDAVAPRAPPAPPTAATLFTSTATAAPGTSITSLDVAWAPPAANSGAPVTGTLVELFSGDAPTPEVQELSVTSKYGRSDVGCPASTNIGACSVQLALAGANFFLPLLATAADVRWALLTLLDTARLPLLPPASVAVTRASTTEGYTWRVTFTGAAVAALGSGNMPLMQLVAPLPAATTAAQNSASNCGSALPPIDNSCISARVTAVTAGVPLYGAGEVQTVALLAERPHSSPPTDFNPPTGFFTLSVVAPAALTSPAPPAVVATTPLMPVGAPGDAVAAVLSATLATSAAWGNYGVRGDVRVTRARYVAVEVVRGPSPVGPLAAVGVAPVQALVNGSSSLIAALYDGWVYRVQFAAGNGDVAVMVAGAERVLRGAGSPSPPLVVVSDGSDAVVPPPTPGAGGFACGDCVKGAVPPGYAAQLLPPGATTARFVNLTAGGRYYVQLSSASALRGVGAPVLAACSPPTAPFCAPDPVPGRLVAALPRLAAASADVYGLKLPQGVPAPPTAVALALDPAGSSSALQVSYGPPADNGGLPVASYRIEWSPAPDFSVALARIDVPCAAAAPSQVVAVTTRYDSSYAGASGIASGTWALSVTRGGAIFTTGKLQFDAPAQAADEVAPDLVFCENEPLPGVVKPPSQCANAGPLATAGTGSVQSALQALPHLGAGSVLGVSRAPRVNGAPGEFTWMVTFAPALGSDVTLEPHGAGTSLLPVELGTNPRGDLVSTAVVTTGNPAPQLMDAACLSPQLITGLTQGTPYYVHVLAYNAEGYSADAAAGSGAAPGGGGGGGAGALAPIRAPGRPTSVALAPASSTQMRVSWGSPLDTGGEAISAYVVSWGTAVDPASGALTGSTGSVGVTYLPDSGPYSRTVSGLTPGTDYYVRVAAVNSRGPGAPAASLPAFDHPRTLPTSPSRVSLAPASPTALVVGWAPPLSDGGDPVTAYRVEWDTDPLFESNRRLPHKGVTTVAASAAASLTVRDLAPGVAYYVRVAAGNAAGFGPAGSDTPAAAAPSQQPPGAPSAITVAPSLQTCRTLNVAFAPPLVPAAGVFCGGGGTAAPTAPAPCAPGTTLVPGVADGGNAISSYEVHYSAYADFRDVAPGGYGVASFAVPAGADPTAPLLFQLGPYGGAGAPLQPGSTYFVRVAARNGVGAGPFCGKEGASCASATVLKATAPPAGAGLNCPPS